MEEKKVTKRYFDKRIIAEIVKQVEEGVPRKELKEKYDLGKSTLGAWMRDYGSNLYKKNKKVSISNLEKRKIIGQIERGQLTKNEVQKLYNIKSVSTINEWIRQSKVEKCILTDGNQEDMKNTNKISLENAELEISTSKALEEARLKIEALNTLIDVAEQEFKINIRKKSGTKQF
jgi:transposase